MPGFQIVEKLRKGFLGNLSILLKNYGFYGLPWAETDLQAKVRLGNSKEIFAQLQLGLHEEIGKKLYSQRLARITLRNLFRLPNPVYYSLLPHITFMGNGLEPLWINESGGASIAWYNHQGQRILLIGLNVEEEIIRHRQGDPIRAKITPIVDRETWGYPGERPLYLFQDQLLDKFPTQPWADNFGFFVAETFARICSFPLIEPLPGGAKGAVILTGDDDQAPLEKYWEQLNILGDFPITYFLHFKTKHTKETLANLPQSVQFGLHPDALDRPDQYESLCCEQLALINRLTGRHVRTVRNHGYLNQGYLGHLSVWEKNGLRLDTNYPGLDGTALNGSFLPMPVRRLDGSWSDHYSLLTTFGDGMLFALQLNPKQAIKRIRKIVRQIEMSRPGVVVLNFHPDNIGVTYELHRFVLGLSRRPGWIALGLESYLEWLEMLESLELEPLGRKRFKLRCPARVKGMVIRYPIEDGWRLQKLETWSDQIEILLA
jgi:hypothetical protein